MFGTRKGVRDRKEKRGKDCPVKRAKGNDRRKEQRRPQRIIPSHVVRVRCAGFVQDARVRDNMTDGTGR